MFWCHPKIEGRNILLSCCITKYIGGELHLWNIGILKDVLFGDFWLILPDISLESVAAYLDILLSSSFLGNIVLLMLSLAGEQRGPRSQSLLIFHIMGIIFIYFWMRQQEIATLSRTYPLVDIIPHNHMSSLGNLRAKGNCNEVLLYSCSVFLSSRTYGVLSQLYCYQCVCACMCVFLWVCMGVCLWQSFKSIHCSSKTLKLFFENVNKSINKIL